MRDTLAVLFPDWLGRPLSLCRVLHGTFPEFRAAFDTVCGALDDVLTLTVPLVAVVFAPYGGVDGRLPARARYGRPALLAYAVALYRLWQERGVWATAVAGDGVGALAAAHVTGELSLRDAARGAAGRSPGADRERAEDRLRAAGHTRLLECGPPHEPVGDPVVGATWAALAQALDGASSPAL